MLGGRICVEKQREYVLVEEERYSHRYREALVVSMEQSNKNCWELTIGHHADPKVKKHALVNGEIRTQALVFLVEE